MKWLPAALLLAWTAGASAAPDAQDSDVIARGRYLAVLGDCVACHTAPGGKPYAGGRMIETPFGKVAGSNITPDPETGIGSWSDQDFIDALQKGLGRGGRHLYPAMPYPYTTHTTRQDVLAIRAYLATVAPVHHVIEPDTLPFPFSIRALMAVWNRLYFTPGEYRPDPSKSADWNRGAYLVTGLEHCGACHTPKTLLGGDRNGQFLEGRPMQGWVAPNITADARRGIGDWSVDDIVAYLRTGHNRVADAAGPMAREIAMSSRHETPGDLRAIAVFLKDQPGHPAPADTPRDPGSPDMKAGQAIYADLCSACHKPDGSGVPGLFPRLAGSGAVQSRDPGSLIQVILRGARSVATPDAPTAAAMPSFAATLTDQQVAAVATFVRNGWGNAAPAVPRGLVARDRASLANRVGD